MDPYENIVELYDLEHDAFQDDVSFFANVIQDGPVLEVGCGTGRIVERLVRRGLEVHGIDTSEAMLTAARRRLAGLAHAHLYHMAAEKISLPQKFQSAIWPLNVLWHLPDQDAQMRALQQVRAHMLGGGLLVVDLSNPLMIANGEGPAGVQLRFQSADDVSEVQGFSNAVDLPTEQQVTLTLWYDRIEVGGIVRRSTAVVPLRYMYRFELELMLVYSGFRLGQIYGSYDLDPYAANSPNMLVVAIAA
jgi:SAM-dependent methyltransferase